MTAAIPESATPVDMPAETRRKVTDLFTRDEIRELTARSDLMGFWAIGSTWALIAAAFTLLVWAGSQPLGWAVPAWIVGLCVIAGRQLCLAILMHDASHGTLFRTRWLNDVVADWTCARPIWNDLRKYKAHHFIHHTKTGTADDTDISLVAAFPCTRTSLARKLLRDLGRMKGQVVASLKELQASTAHASSSSATRDAIKDGHVKLRGLHQFAGLWCGALAAMTLVLISNCLHIRSYL